MSQKNQSQSSSASSFRLPDSTLLGLDVSHTALGLARSDPGMSLAVPLRTLSRRDLGVLEIIAILKSITKEISVKGLVCGWPLERDGKAGDACAKAHYFAQTLSLGVGLPVVYWDERFSTQQAKDRVMEMMMGEEDRGKRVANNRVKSWAEKRRKLKEVDATAAAMCLQSYLDALERGEQGLVFHEEDELMGTYNGRY